MSRTFGSPNDTPPKWFTAMSANPPACFDRQQWTLYLESVRDESQDNASMRAKLCRGQVPDYCAECTAQHQRRKVRQDKCHPPAGACTPLLPIESQG
jgi:hypothetical protein